MALKRRPKFLHLSKNLSLRANFSLTDKISIGKVDKTDKCFLGIKTPVSKIYLINTLLF